LFRKAGKSQHDRESGEIVAGERVERPARVKRKSEFADAGWNDIPLALGAVLVLSRRRCESGWSAGSVPRPENVRHAGRIGHRRKISVGRRRYPTFDLHDPTSEMSAASTA